MKWCIPPIWDNTLSILFIGAAHWPHEDNVIQPRDWVYFARKSPKNWTMRSFILTSADDFVQYSRVHWAALISAAQHVQTSADSTVLYIAAVVRSVQRNYGTTKTKPPKTQPSHCHEAATPRSAQWLIICSRAFGCLPLWTSRMKQLPRQQKLIAMITEALPSGATQREDSQPSPNNTQSVWGEETLPQPDLIQSWASQKRETAAPGCSWAAAAVCRSGLGSGIISSITDLR